MSDDNRSALNLSRRRFLAGLAVLGATPVASRLAALEGFDMHRGWTGDNFDEGHAFLRNPQALLREGGRIVHADPFEVLVVGGGISGLTATYTLGKQGRKALLLEREPETGGVSKSANWNGIEYALGAAYMIDPEDGADVDGSPEQRNFGLLVDLGLRQPREDLYTERGKNRRWSGGDNHCVFTNSRVLAEHDVYSHQNDEFFTTVYESDNFPAIPPDDEGLVAKLDGMSFQQFLLDAALQHELYGKTVGEISPAGWEAIEYYFWGAFGNNSWETSAYHGLNFFAGEFGKVLAFPGGNAYIAKRLTERIKERDAGAIRTGHYVLSIEPDGAGGGWTVLALHDGKVHQLRGRAVIFASPLFLAKRMVPSLPPEQVQAMDALDYRSYVVANVLLRGQLGKILGPEFAKAYEMTRIHGVDIRHSAPEEVSAKGVFSDIVNAGFPVWNAGEHAVLTVYRPYPYNHGREKLRYLEYDAVEAEIRRAMLEGYGQHGLSEQHIEGIRLTRWGHPMLIPRPGQISKGGLIETARRSHPGLAFAHTDTQGAPAIENALAAAHLAVEEVKSYLR